MNTGFSLLGSISELFSSRTSNSKPKVDNKQKVDVFKDNFEDKLKSSKKRFDEGKYDEKDINKLDEKNDKKSYEKVDNEKINNNKNKIDKKSLKNNSDTEDKELDKEIKKDDQLILKMNDINVEDLKLQQEDLKKLESLIDQIKSLDEDVDKAQLMSLMDSLKEMKIDLQKLGIDFDLVDKIESMLNPKTLINIDSLNNKNISNEELNIEIENLKNSQDNNELEELKVIIKNLKEELKEKQNNVDSKEIVGKENLKEVPVINKDTNINSNNIGNIIKEVSKNGQINFDDLDFEQSDSKEHSNTNMASSIKFASNISKTTNAKVNPTFENMVLKQVTDEIKLNIKKDISTLEMKLEPETLGKVTLRIALEKGALNIKVLAQDDKVKETLENNIEELKSVLEEQGLSVDNLEVSVNDDSEFRRHRDMLKAMSLNKSTSKNDFTLFDEEELSIEEIKNPYLNDDEFNEFA